MILERMPEIQHLSAEEKLALVSELWADLAAHPEDFPSRADHIELLQERMEHYRRHPEDVISWEALKQRILSSA